MAFSNSPELQTYKSVEVKFDGFPTYRTGNLATQRDINIVNFYYDRISQENKEREVKLIKRPGLKATTYSLSKAASSDVLRGSFYHVDQNTFYWAVNDKVYSVSPDVGTTVRTVTTLTTSSGLVGFCSFLKSDDTRYIIFSDGTDLWVDNYATVTCTKVVDADLPSPHQPSPVYLDGYLFLIEGSSGNIWNSDVDDPFTWTAGSYIQSEINSDYGVRLLKAKNYLICLGYNSAEYFWDAGNSPGSPLSRNDSPVRTIGYLTNLCTIGDTTYFVGQDGKQNIGVYAINSFKIERISNPVVDRTIQTIGSTNNEKSQVTLDKDGYAISVDGHHFYVLPTPQTTWVYEVEDKVWYEWKGSDGLGLGVEATWAMYDGSMYVAIKGQTYISLLSPAIYQDFGANFTCKYTTENTTFGTSNWKILHRLFLNCSKHSDTGTSNATIEYSPDDWSPTGVVGTRTINVFSNSPYCTRLGKFRNISFRVSYTDNYPFFMTALQADINVYGI